MELNIKIIFDSGIEMENNLNKALKDFEQAVKNRGLIDIDLECIDCQTSNQKILVYKLTVTK